MATTNTTNREETAPTRDPGELLGAPSTAALGRKMSETSDDANAPTPRHALNPPGRLWAGAFVGAIVAIPLAWLLSYGATLPFLLGIFFFALFGLIIGAATFRVAAPRKPYGKTAVLTVTTALVAYVFAFALVKESRDLPSDIAKKAAKKTADLGGRTGAEYRADVATEVEHYLQTRYAPGGTFGYVRWVLTNGKIARGGLPSVDADLTALQTRTTWAIRVVLSIALLAFGIGSQTLGLAKRGGMRSR